MNTTVTFAEWIAQMEEVRAEIIRVRELNAPTELENRRIDAENTRHGTKLFRRKTLPCRIGKWAEERMDRETQIKYGLKNLRPGEWKERLEAILDKNTRNRAASIVWWDYFGYRTVKHRWPHLDKMINAPVVRVPVEHLADALYSVGYSPWEARNRSAETCDEVSRPMETETELAEV